MIDLDDAPYPPGADIEALPKYFQKATLDDFQAQREAVKSLREVQQAGVNHLHFINVLREMWAHTGNDRHDEDFNSLLYFISAITKSCGDTAALIEQLPDFEKKSFFDSSQNIREVVEHTAALKKAQEATE